MSHIDETYKNMVNEILESGERRSNRTGIDTIAIFGYQFRHDLRTGFPLLTTKKVYFDSVVKELFWFLRGETNIKTLGCGIWDSWSDENGECGPIYGKQWIAWEKYVPTKEILDTERGFFYYWSFDKYKVNQIEEAIKTIKENPDSRRIIVSAWNVADLPKMALAPCHAFFQFNCSGPYLDLQLYQRSADTALGVPFNIASYALLLSMVAKETGRIPRHFVHTFGDLHIYVNHVEGLKSQLERESYPMPEIEIPDEPFKNLQDSGMIKLKNYQHHPHIKFDVAV